MSEVSLMSGGARQPNPQADIESGSFRGNY